LAADRRWYDLGRYQILAKPLDTNPYWTTHHIYLRGECIGKQLSVPCLSDCDWYAAGSVYLRRAYSGTFASYESILVTHRRPGPGRPRKDSAKSPLREFLDALAN